MELGVIQSRGTEIIGRLELEKVRVIRALSATVLSVPGMVGERERAELGRVIADLMLAESGLIQVVRTLGKFKQDLADFTRGTFEAEDSNA